MSTELKTLNGQFHNQQTNEMENTKMSLTRFSGGKEGMKIQLTMREQGNFFTHITLNKEELKTLVKEIQENFDL
jgi:ABC-type transport system involved in cytochrome c biogenesis ATPase subunit